MGVVWPEAGTWARASAKDQGSRGGTGRHARRRTPIGSRGGYAVESRRHRTGVCGRAVGRGFVPALRQSPAGGGLCRPCADAMAKRVDRPGTGDRKVRELSRLRSTLLEMAWLWLRHQPASTLSRWFNDRVAQNGGRFKKVMITALARKLVVALWKYVSAGVVIEGAVVRP